MDWREAALVIAGLWLGALSFFGRRELKRLDDKADKEQLADLLKRMEKRDDEARESRRSLHAKIDTTNTNLSSVSERVARIEGKLNGQGR